MQEFVDDVMSEISDGCVDYTLGEYLEFLDRLISALQDKYRRLEAEQIWTYEVSK